MYSRRSISDHPAFVYVYGFLFDPKVTPTHANEAEFFVLTQALSSRSSQFYWGSAYINKQER